MTNAIAERVERMTPAMDGARAEPTSMLQAIVAMATRPDLDPARFEWAISMHERLQAQEAKRQYDEAMAEMQPHLPIIGERGTTNNGTYAKWDDINEQVKPVLAQHGFGLTHRSRQEGNRIFVTCIVSHRGGHREETTLDGEPDKSGSKNGIQALGSTLSYLQRYTAKLLLNLTSRKSDDDDGRKSGGPARITEEQAMDMRDLLESTGANVPLFLLKVAKVERLEDIEVSRFESLCAAIRRRAAERDAK